ncbi:hypothetical protein [Streptomyces sp. NPDC051211]|uniref:hypothetical protein n=1 Tax=Streptomyces sp. NPDC051211 TaxID=3154643 RepID=UPI00344B4DC3
MARKTLLIAVLHRGPQGRASPLAFAARDGAAEAGVRSVLVGAEGLGEAQWALLEAAGGYVFGAPLPAEAADRRSSWAGRPAGGFTEDVPGADPYERQRRMAASAARLGLRWIVPEVLPSWYSACDNESALDAVRQVGGLVAHTLRAGLAASDGHEGRERHDDRSSHDSRADLLGLTRLTGPVDLAGR